MLFRLVLLLTVLPLTELWLLVWIKDQTSWSVTILLVLLTGVLGAALARWQGWQTIGRIQQELSQGRMPTDSLFDGVLILVAGIVLITPGLLTDAAGFALLVPACRGLVKRYLRARFRTQFLVHAHRPMDRDGVRRPGDRDEIIDVRLIDDGVGTGNSTSPLGGDSD